MACCRCLGICAHILRDSGYPHVPACMAGSISWRTGLLCYSLLSTSLTVIVPLLNWSSTLRHLGSRDGRETGTRAIVLYWGCLIAVGLLTSFLLLRGFYLDESSLTPIACVPPGSKINITAGELPSWPNIVINSERLQENGCMDPCKTSALNLVRPVALFRSSSDLRSMTQREFIDTFLV